jgi:upstream activation factor subunit UAF30
MATSKKSAGKSSAKKAAPAKKAAAKSGAKSAGKSTAKSTAKGGAKSAGKSAAKGAAKGGAAKSARKPNAAFMKPMQPSAELGAVVGTQPQPRSEITKRVWDYIKKNNLQDQQNKRQINADDKLRPVFGGKKNVTMFEMTSLVNKHLGEV